MFAGSRTGGWKIWESYASNYVQCTLYKNEINTSFFSRYFHMNTKELKDEKLSKSNSYCELTVVKEDKNI